MLSAELAQVLATTETVVQESVMLHADRVDQEGRWPAESLAALRAAGLTRLTVPQRAGGLGMGLLATAVVTESIAQACPSTAMCFGMHCVATAVIAAKATPEQDERYLRPIARGEHLSSLALSEAGTGANFYLPETSLSRAPTGFRLNGVKQFVTSGGEADSYVVSCVASDDTGAGEFSCLVLDRGTPGMHWGPPWQGVGMRGNSSRTLTLTDATADAAALLGAEGDQIWYVFEVVAPFFLVAMASTYVGIGRAAVGTAVQHLKSRRFSHSGETAASLDTVQHRLGSVWAEVERAGLMLRRAAELGDAGSPDALPSILACKADAADAAVSATNEAMTLCGGAAYRENSRLARLLRDARASHVMSPTTDMLRLWTGRQLLGLSLF